MASTAQALTSAGVPVVVLLAAFTVPAGRVARTLEALAGLGVTGARLTQVKVPITLAGLAVVTRLERVAKVPVSTPLTLGPSVACPALALVAPKVEVRHTSWGEVVGAEGQRALAGLAGIGCSKGGVPKKPAAQRSQRGPTVLCLHSPQAPV